MESKRRAKQYKTVRDSRHFDFEGFDIDCSLVNWGRVERLEEAYHIISQSPSFIILKWWFYQKTRFIGNTCTHGSLYICAITKILRTYCPQLLMMKKQNILNAWLNLIKLLLTDSVFLFLHMDVHYRPRVSIPDEFSNVYALKNFHFSACGFSQDWKQHLCSTCKRVTSYFENNVVTKSDVVRATSSYSILLIFV